MNKTIQRILIAAVALILLGSAFLLIRFFARSIQTGLESARLPETVQTQGPEMAATPVPVQAEPAPALTEPAPTAGPAPAEETPEPQELPEEVLDTAVTALAGKGEEEGAAAEETSPPETPEAVEEEQPARTEKRDYSFDFEDILPQYRAYREENEDLVGWLRIDNTVIDYPVMYTPEEQNLYLHLDFYGNASDKGTLFIAVPWYQSHTIIYGHNMRDGSMFGSLPKYTSESFFKENPYIYFDTMTETGTYEVVGCFLSQIMSLETAIRVGGFRYWNYLNLGTEELFNEYISQVKSHALYDTGVDAEFGDEILTLSTCYYHVQDGRLVIVAKRIA